MYTYNIMDAVNEDTTYEKSKEFTEHYILPFVKHAHVCSQNAYECTSKKSYCLNRTIWSYNNYRGIYRIMLSNGVVVHFWPKGAMVEIYVDINGASRPNTLGKDIFCMHIRKSAFGTGTFGSANNKSGLFFYGEGKSREQLKTEVYPCAKTGPLAGVYCGALIKLDGWEIKDDYPW